MRTLLLLGATLALSLSASAQTRVFVADIEVEKGVEMDSKALTSSLCASIMKLKNVEVICAPDVRQLLDFQSQLAMLGKSPAISKLEQQVASTPFVIAGAVSRDEKKRVKMDVGLYKTGIAEGVFISPGEEISMTVERVKKAGALLGRVDGVAQSLGKHLGPQKVTGAAETAPDATKAPDAKPAPAPKKAP